MEKDATSNEAQRDLSEKFRKEVRSAARHASEVTIDKKTGADSETLANMMELADLLKQPGDTITLNFENKSNTVFANNLADYKTLQMEGLRQLLKANYGLTD